MTVAIQGVAFEYGRIFASDNEFWYAKHGCFGSINDVDLLIGHQGKSYANTENRLQIHSGDDALVFRAYFSDDWFAKELSEQTDEMETYLAVSAGLTITKTETVVCDGGPVKVILAANLSEVSLIDKTPAVDTTYARVVSEEKCSSLEEDYPMIMAVGRFIGLHRKVMAAENNGEVKYAYSPTAYERASDRFVRALAKLQ
jgi:hypothetical protein